MSRPRNRKRCRCTPEVLFYKPQGVHLQSLEVIDISLEEFEALRLRNVKKLNQIESAKQMNTSQSTFQRILTSALEKISTAIVTGQAIRIAKK